jgi:VanZ family protein
MVKSIILTTLTVIWMVVIFWFSNQKAPQSTGNSQSFIRKTIVIVYKLFNPNASQDKIDSIVEKYDVPVRKLAHFTEYFILGVLVFFTLNSYGIKNAYIMAAICALYAGSDEFHQLFVEGRDGNIIDFLIDSAGSILAIVLFRKL